MAVIARRWARAALVAAALALVAACGDDGSSSATTAAPTTTATPPTASPGTASPTTTAPVPTDPESYATAFVEAWERGDRATAEALGTTDAVDALFAEDPGSAGSWSLATCDGAAGSSYCTFTSGGSSIVVRVGNERASSGEPQAVDEVRIGG